MIDEQNNFVHVFHFAKFAHNYIKICLLFKHSRYH